MIKPRIIATWPFGKPACELGMTILNAGGCALDAVEQAANLTELDPAVQSVGYGGLPNSDGIVELDAAIMDGATHSAGAVCGLTGIRRSISVACKVMELTPHVMLCGLGARRFALANGFQNEDLNTEAAQAKYQKWREQRTSPDVSHFDVGHDTIGLCALDNSGNLAAGCTSSGMAWKVPGRVGDSPIIGSGLYVDNRVGAAAATGNGDEMMKVCLSYRVVMLMELGRTPQEACEQALQYLIKLRPDSQGLGAACIALSADGEVGSAATKDGFSQKRIWIWCVGGEEGITVNRGPYVS